MVNLELQPAWVVQTWLDGDDSAAASAETVERHFKLLLSELQEEHSIRAWILERIDLDERRADVHASAREQIEGLT